LSSADRGKQNGDMLNSTTLPIVLHDSRSVLFRTCLSILKWLEFWHVTNGIAFTVVPHSVGKIANAGFLGKSNMCCQCHVSYLTLQGMGGSMPLLFIEYA